MVTIHVFLLNQHEAMNDPTDSIIYGSSTSNKIERWWRELHERLKKFFMSFYQLSSGSVTYLSSTGIVIEFEGKIN